MSRLRRGLLRAGLSLLLLGLGACATPPRPTPAFSGRLQVVAEAGDSTPRRTWATSFELHGDARQGQLLIDGPLGTRLADARWDAHGVLLRTSDGEQRFDDLAALSLAVLGEDLPLAALPDWLAGQPWPQAPQQSRPQGFAQLGWEVDLSQHTSAGLLLARRAEPAPALALRIVLDR